MYTALVLRLDPTVYGSLGRAVVLGLSLASSILALSYLREAVGGFQIKRLITMCGEEGRSIELSRSEELTRAFTRVVEKPELLSKLIELFKTTQALVLEISCDGGNCRLLVFSGRDYAARFVKSIIPEDYLPEAVLMCEDVDLFRAFDESSSTKIAEHMYRILNQKFIVVDPEYGEFEVTLSEYVERVDLCHRLDLYPDPRYLSPLLRRNYLLSLVDDLVYYVQKYRVDYQSLYTVVRSLEREQLIGVFTSCRRLADMIVENLLAGYHVWTYTPRFEKIDLDNVRLDNIMMLPRVDAEQYYSHGVEKMCIILNKASSLVLEQLPRRDVRMLKWRSMQAAIVDGLTMVLEQLEEHEV